LSDRALKTNPTIHCAGPPLDLRFDPRTPFSSRLQPPKCAARRRIHPERVAPLPPTTAAVALGGEPLPWEVGDAGGAGFRQGRRRGRLAGPPPRDSAWDAAGDGAADTADRLPRAALARSCLARCPLAYLAAGHRTESRLPREATVTVASVRRPRRLRSPSPPPRASRHAASRR
jgi:hypothetical protein